MDGASLNITQDLIQKLKEIVPQAFTEDKIDISRLQTILGDSFTTDAERYGLLWAGKSEAYKVLQTPSTATLIPNPDKSIDWDNAENIFIEGENLEVLKVLQKSYYGKVKMIYIDPPYNTGSDSFIYPDKFSETKEEYLKRIGDKDDDGLMMKEGLFRKNNKENGQFHSNWLNMMLPRLFLARNLLKDDGVIFVSIDDNEQSNLKLLMDEIFGEENFRNIITVRRYDKNLNRQFIDQGLKTFNVGYEYILCYAKSDKFSFNPIYKDSSEDRQAFGYWKGFWNDAERPTMRYDILGYTPENGQWKWSKEKSLEAVKNYQIYQQEFSSTMTLEEYWESTGKKLSFIKRNGNGNGKNKGVENWIPPSNGTLRNTNWTDLFASKNEKEIEGLFDYPKNVEVIKNLIYGGCNEEDIILDFFAGSGTTAQAVLEFNEKEGFNCKYICVQLPEKTVEESDAHKAGFKVISEITQERITKIITKIKNKRNGTIDFSKNINLGFRKYTLKSSNFKIWRGDVVENEDDLIKQMQLFTTPQKENTQNENILWELLIKNGVPLTEKIECSTLQDGAVIYYTANKKLAFVLDSYTDEVQTAVLALKPKNIICLDSLFHNNDNVKTNAQLKFEDNGISFKTI